MQNRQRLSRNDWLKNALSVARAKGEEELKIDKICRHLKVTKGSFYAHFESRKDFIQQLVDYWRTEFTESVIQKMDLVVDEPPEHQLLTLMTILRDGHFNNSDAMFRSWALHDATVHKGVAEVDSLRYDCVRAIFKHMGFVGGELEMRTRMFVVYESMVGSFLFLPFGLDADAELASRHAFYTKA